MIKGIWHRIVHKNKYIINKIKWRKKNKHNFTSITSIFSFDKVTVGNYTYGPLNIFDYENSNERLTIGNFCSLASNVKFLLGGEHHPDFLMNYPFKLRLFPNDDIDDRRTKGPIIVKDDVWIGEDSIILSGVTIGQGAIIASGSVVAKDVPPYAIYTTNRIIKYRFSPDIIEILLKIDFSKLDFKFVKEHIELFYTSNIEQILNDCSLEKYYK